MAALLTASSIRIDVARIPAVDGLTFESTGDRLLVLGGARALFEAAAGLRSVARGELRVEGQVPLDAVRAGAVASAPLDPPMPAAWTVGAYVVWSARLAGLARGVARSAAQDALGRLQLGDMARTKLRAVSGTVRRGTVIAAALATGAATLLVEDPFTGLAPDVARPFARVVTRALDDRRTAFFAARMSLDGPVALAADEAVVVEGSHAAAQGAPAEIAARERAYAVRVGGDVRSFAEAVEAQGAKLLGAPGPFVPATLSLDLGALRARDVLRIALNANAVVLELRPLAGVFA